MPVPAVIQNALRMSVKPSIINPYVHGLPPGSKDFICSLTCADRKMDVYQSTGPGAGEPILEHVIEFLIEDTKTMLNVTFNTAKADWEAKFQRRALETRAENFASLLGGELYQHVLTHIGVA
jgi:hypothetical protein